MGNSLPGRPRVTHLTANTLATKVAVYALGFIASVLIARALGPSGRGRYYLPVTMATIAFYIGNMGTEQAQFRTWSRREASSEDLVTSGIFFGAGLGALFSVLAWLAFLLGRTSLFAALRPLDVAIVIVTIPLQIHSLILSGLLIVGGRLTRNNLASLAGAFVQVGGVVALFFTRRISVETVLLFYAASSLVSWMAMLPTALSIGKPRLPVPWRLMRSQLLLGAQLEPYLLFSYLNLRIDVFFVAQYLGLAGVGLYSVAVAMSELVWLVTDSVTYSIVERQANASEEEAFDVTLRSVRMNVLLSLLLITLIGAAAPILIRLVYGSAFASARFAVWALLPAGVAMAVWRPLGAMVLRLGRPWLQPLISLLSLAVNIAANIILIPRLGIAGAGLASSLSYSSGALVAAGWILRRRKAPISELVPKRREAQLLLSLLSPNSFRQELSRMLHK